MGPVHICVELKIIITLKGGLSWFEYELLDAKGPQQSLWNSLIIKEEISS